MMNTTSNEMTVANIWLQLLDSTHSYPTQTWKLKGKPSVRIGRSDDNEVVIQNPSVSRVHVVLDWVDGGWNLVNVGRFGTIVGGQAIGQLRLDKDLTIQLGPVGPSIRLLLSEGSRDHHGETCELPTVSLAEINEALKQKKVAEIAESDFFQELQKRAKQMRTKDQGAFDPEDTI